MANITRKVAQSAALLFISAAMTLTCFALPARIEFALAQSATPDRLARVEATLIRKHIRETPRTTILYLNGIDGGDNYYRVRYLLYPLQFVNYWSWKHPNAGGEVWNKPRFATETGLRAVLLRHRVDYLVAYRQPAMLRLIGLHTQDFLLFRVNRHALRKSGSLKAALHLLLRRRLPWKKTVLHARSA